ncbi:MAG TPA: 2OG-Fe(II) oxygenase [Pseudonocardiaceae bacterium]|nr:2OG-Fe(II) oxygenase [Pseudonocardiaceae bacterium]
MQTLTPNDVTTWNWPAIAKSLDEQGYATTPPALSPADCAELIALYDQPEAWQDRIQQDTYRLGPGEHQRFTTPPPTVVELQTNCYPQLAALTELWQDLPPNNNPQPTTLMTKHRAHEYQSLHQQDERTFPLQLTIMLSQHRKQYTGGELLLVENHPRAQSRGRAITLKQGEAVIHPSNHRTARGKRGYYKVNVRQGISKVHTGTRHALTITYHHK